MIFQRAKNLATIKDEKCETQPRGMQYVEYSLTWKKNTNETIRVYKQINEWNRMCIVYVAAYTWVDAAMGYFENAQQPRPSGM